MEKSIVEMRSAIVQYYEDKGYSHKHAEAYVPNDADQIRRVFSIIQEEKGNEPTGSQECREPVGFFLSRSKWNWATLGKVG